MCGGVCLWARFQRTYWQGGEVVTAEDGVLHGTVRAAVLDVCQEAGTVTWRVL